MFTSGPTTDSWQLTVETVILNNMYMNMVHVYVYVYVHICGLYGFYPTGVAHDYPRTCNEVPNEGFHLLDPEQDGLDPISVFCNMSSTPITAVLHHNLENWTTVSGYEEAGSYNGQVRYAKPPTRNRP